jgi:hypothetical protein
MKDAVARQQFIELMEWTIAQCRKPYAKPDAIISFTLYETARIQRELHGKDTDMDR